jgi:hypothetical protein
VIHYHSIEQRRHVHKIIEKRVAHNFLTPFLFMRTCERALSPSLNTRLSPLGLIRLIAARLIVVLREGRISSTLQT